MSLPGKNCRTTRFIGEQGYFSPRFSAVSPLGTTVAILNDEGERAEYRASTAVQNGRIKADD
jgi:hypothetical protein